MSQMPVDSQQESSARAERIDLPEPRSTRGLARGLTITAIVALLAIVAVEAKGLWQEWSELRNENAGIKRNAVIGYRDISPIVTYAVGPPEWFRHEGNHSLLWARWESGVGHQWFRFTSGDIDRAHVARPKTVMISRPVDYPIVETGGGEVWQRVPPDSQVVGHTLRGVKCVYPVLLLAKVQVVNDLVADHPFLVVTNSFASPEKAYSIYDAIHDGHRVTMDATGYFHDSKPLLYDRGTRSLWVEENESLTAIAGRHKRQKLPRVAKPVPVTWERWLRENSGSRLLVGADRSHGVPLE